MAMPPPPPPMPTSPSRLEEGLRPGEPPKEPASLFVVCMNVLNTITHLLLGSVAIFAFIIINIMSEVLPHPKLSAHVYLTVIGYVLLMSQAVLSLNPQSGWENNLKYPQKTKLYWFLQVLGSTLAVIGGIMGIVGYADLPNNLPDWFPVQITVRHLQSSHGIVGFIALILTSMSLVGGIVHLVCPGMVNSFLLRAIYIVIGTLSLTMAFIAICIAFDGSEALIFKTNANLAMAFTILALLGMLTMMISNMAKRGTILI